MSLGSSQKGKAVETLLAATCIIGADGKLSVSIPVVDDEGVDLIFAPKGGGKSISVQVKSRFGLSTEKTYRSEARKKAMLPRSDYYILFAYYETDSAKLGDKVWLIPSVDFTDKLAGQKRDRSKYIFQSRFNSTGDMWAQYKIAFKDLPNHILEILKQA